MNEELKDKLIFFLIGLTLGMVCTFFAGIYAYKLMKSGKEPLKAASSTAKSYKPPKRNHFDISFESKDDFKVFKSSDQSAFEPSDSHATKGNKSLAVKIPSGKAYPGLEWEVYGRDVQNWKGASDFHFDVYNNNEDFVNLEVKFKSGKNYPKKSFTYSVQLDPLADNHISIPIESIANKIDLTKISYVKIFAKSPKHNLFLFFDNFGTN